MITQPYLQGIQILIWIVGIVSDFPLMFALCYHNSHSVVSVWYLFGTCLVPVLYLLRFVTRS